uniref:Uncharacterized protein n=1 Tax=Anopheles maculatus TaxID=74869 RepID=A0A182SQH4_9DIPT
MIDPSCRSTAPQVVPGLNRDLDSTGASSSSNSTRAGGVASTSTAAALILAVSGGDNRTSASTTLVFGYRLNSHHHHHHHHHHHPHHHGPHPRDLSASPPATITGHLPWTPAAAAAGTFMQDSCDSYSLRHEHALKY